MIARVESGGRDEVVIGRLREVEFFPGYLLGEARCGQLLAVGLSQELQAELGVMCRGQRLDGAVLRGMARDYDENFLVGLYRRAQSWPVDSERLARYVAAPGVGEESAAVGHVVMALARWMEGEELLGLEELAFADGLISLAGELGPGLLEVTLEGLLAGDEESVLAAMNAVKRYERWVDEEFPLELHRRLGRLFRDVLLPERAIPHLVALVERGEFDGAVLRELARAYQEAGQYYRAYATLLYLQEGLQLRGESTEQVLLALRDGG